MEKLFIYKIEGAVCGLVRANDEDDAAMKVKDRHGVDSDDIEIEEIPTYTDVIPMEM